MRKFLGTGLLLFLFLGIGFANINEKDKELTVYPNPVVEKTLYLNSSQEIAYIEVVNILGNVVHKEHLAEPSLTHEIQFKNNLDKGVYLLKAETSDQTTFVKKFMAK